jgi:hypothetical protein
MQLARVGSRLFDPAAIVFAEASGDAGGGKSQTVKVGLSSGATLEFKDAEAGVVWDKSMKINSAEDWVNPAPFRGIHKSPTAP